MEKEQKKDFISGLKRFFSPVLTFVLVLDHYFVFILILIIATLVVLFGYDRYAARTYLEDSKSEFLMGFLAHDSAYKSPLKQGGRSLFSELSSIYSSEAYRGKLKKISVEDSVYKTKFLKKLKNIKKAKKEPQKTDNKQQESAVKDQQPIGGEDYRLPHSSIQQEVNSRIHGYSGNSQK